MNVLIDTNILIRAAHRKSPAHRQAINALRTLRTRGDRICVVPQNLYEFWAVATRSIKNNGLDHSPNQASRLVSIIEESCMVFRDPPELYDEWRRLVVLHGVSGKKAHDTRLVAAMKVHRITQILTYNVDDFIRYSSIEALEPGSLIGG